MTNCFLRSQRMASHGVSGIFSLRHGGVSPPPFDSLNLGYGLGDADKSVKRNMDILIRQADLACPPHQARQVHGMKAIVCRNTGKMHGRDADILIGLGQTAVAVRVADCVPVLLADPAAGLIAAVHAGWRGTVLGAAMHAVRTMQRHGGKVERMLAWIGPCIGPCCFKIDTKTAEKLAGCCGGADECIRLKGDEAQADLAGINERQLKNTGIADGHIEKSAACTCCDAGRFYSYRRDGGKTGRHLAIIASHP